MTCYFFFVTYNISMNKKTAPTKTLGTTSAKLIDTLNAQGVSFFTLDDAARVLPGKTRNTIDKLLSNLTKRGILARLKSQTYLILQSGKEQAQLSNWPLIAHELANKEYYFLSHYSAMRLHGMTTHPLMTVYITVNKRTRNRIVNGIKYQFISLNPNFFWGATSMWVTKHDKVSVSDLERTILDALGRPELCGGIKEIIRGIWSKKKLIDWEKLLQYAQKYPIKAAIKRLGFISEILQIESPILPQLISITALAKDYVLLDPTSLKIGKYHSRWHLQINLNLAEINASIWE